MDSSSRRLALPLLAALLLSLLAGCSSTEGGGSGALHPGDTVAYEGERYQLMQVQEDFVLLRYRDPEERGGLISGYVDEVFRVSRYDLGQGRWYGSSRMPGIYVQWNGLDEFALESDRKVLGGAEVVMLR